MIVPNMSLTEIRKAISDDFDNEIKRKIQLVKITHQGKWMRNGRKDFVETILFPSKSKNNWRITITCNSGGVHSVPYLVSYNNTGITASHIDPEGAFSSLMHFNTHFFKRYRERGKVGIEKPEDLVKFFFKKNSVLLTCYYPREDGTQQLFTPLTGGVGLGNYHEESDICEFKTFVDDSLLREDQKVEIINLWKETLKERWMKFKGASIRNNRLNIEKNQ
jgi:hypothetical protein